MSALSVQLCLALVATTATIENASPPAFWKQQAALQDTFYLVPQADRQPAVAILTHRFPAGVAHRVHYVSLVREPEFNTPEVSLRSGGLMPAGIQKPKVELPATVAKAFKEAFPKAEIEKLDVDEENGVTVYDVEFKNGAREQETDIAADGTILEVTLVVEPRAVPVAAMKAIAKAANGGEIGRIEKIDISYETRNGRAVKLPKPITHYAAEIAIGGKNLEIVVTPEGVPVKEER